MSDVLLVGTFLFFLVLGFVFFVCLLELALQKWLPGVYRWLNRPLVTIIFGERAARDELSQLGKRVRREMQDLTDEYEDMLDRSRRGDRR